ncbi:hypothetical protein Dimus_026483 [Dionaea muscipula]
MGLKLLFIPLNDHFGPLMISLPPNLASQGGLGPPWELKRNPREDLTKEEEEEEGKEEGRGEEELRRVKEMKETSKVIMGATLVMVLSLAIVLSLVLVLLAELYCSLLLRRRRQLGTPKSSAAAAAAAETPVSQPRDQTVLHSSLSSFISQGVLDAPRSFLFPKLPPSKREQQQLQLDDLEKQWSNFHHFLTIGSSPESNTSLHPSSLSSWPPPPPSYTPQRGKPGPSTAAPMAEDTLVCGGGGACDVVCHSGSKEQLVYISISNPIYDIDPVDPTIQMGFDTTPFQTPDTSPSRLEKEDGCSSGEQEIVVEELSPCVGPIPQVLLTPPLTPIKELPAEACSVALREAGSLATSGGTSESNSHNGASSSSTSGTPRTSPSW